MKKIISTFILLLSLVGCSNNVTSSNICSCVENPLNQECKLTFKLITNVGLEDITAIEGGYPAQSLRTKVKEEEFEAFYNLLDREYTKEDNEYLINNFIYDAFIVWNISLKNKCIGFIKVETYFDYEMNNYFVIRGAKQSYISTALPNEDFKL